MAQGEALNKTAARVSYWFILGIIVPITFLEMSISCQDDQV